MSYILLEFSHNSKPWIQAARIKSCQRLNVFLFTFDFSIVEREWNK